MDARKQKLIEALEAEKDRLDRQGKDVMDHVLAISYLKTGVRPQVDIDSFDILYAAIYDYDYLCSDYR